MRATLPWTVPGHRSNNAGPFKADASTKMSAHVSFAIWLPLCSRLPARSTRFWTSKVRLGTGALANETVRSTLPVGGCPKKPPPSLRGDRARLLAAVLSPLPVWIHVNHLIAIGPPVLITTPEQLAQMLAGCA